MENKYYTPSIEEFHQEFEYEWNYNNEGWKKDKFDINSGDTDSMAGDWYEFSPNCPLTICRVKYLDKQDIEELGWKFAATNKIVNYYSQKEEWFNTTIPNSPSGRYWSLLLCHDPELKTIKITANTNYGNIDDVFFEGHIKNKSELKKLMKQLGIC